MKKTESNQQRGAVLPYFIVIVATFFAMAAVLWLARDEARPPSIGAERGELRKKNLEEVQAAGQAALSDYAVVNAEQGIYQIPIERAIDTVIREWKKPDAALAQLSERVDLATTLPPPPPEAPSEFE